MSTTQQKLFNRWIASTYPQLQQTMPLKDILHSAYITVYEIRRPIMPTADTFSRMLDEAYHRHFLSEFNHAMRYTLPDPSFWMFMEQNQSTEEDAPSAPSRSVSDLTSYNMRKLFAFVRTNFTPEVYRIFKLAVVEQKSYNDIAQITGKTKREVKLIIDTIEQSLRKNK